MAREQIIPVFVPHLGCPHHCVFCNQNHITGEDRPAEVPDADGGQIAFYGGSFTCIPVEKQIEYLEKAAGHEIRLSTRPDAIDDETLYRLKKYGVTTIELGAQSMDDGVLEAAGRGHTADDVERASVKIKNAGFRLILQMMTGLPGDCDEKDIESARRIIELKPDGARIYPTVIVRDTELETLWRRGEYREHTVEDAVRVCSVILPMFEDAGIPVIRLGLNPTDDLSGGDALAGAYHPALGELVKSRIWRNRIEQQVAEGAEIIEVPEQCLSQAIGQHRENIEYFREKYGKDIKIKAVRKTSAQ